MTEKAAAILEQLKLVNPLNFLQVTTGSVSQHESFHSVWFRHTPQAARFMLLPYFYDGRIEFKP